VKQTHTEERRSERDAEREERHTHTERREGVKKKHTGTESGEKRGEHTA